MSAIKWRNQYSLNPFFFETGDKRAFFALLSPLLSDLLVKMHYRNDSLAAC
jgi:hypothetical protein